MKKQARDDLDDQVAIIGMSGRFPGADSIDRFMDLLEQGFDGIREIPPERWRWQDLHATDRREDNRSVSRWCGILDGIGEFDHRFFGISPKVAATMDPQQRLLLQESWHCFEDAGVSVSERQGLRTGVFVGVMATDYHQILADPRRTVQATDGLGAYGGILANRVSHALGLRGPSMTLDAACASSLVALDQARRAIQSGLCDLALVASVSLNLDPWKYLSFSKAGMLSPTGRCHTFDVSADGYVPGDGVVAVLLERQGRARRRGRRSYALIRGSALNHCADAGGITHPSMRAQADVIEQALTESGLAANAIGYWEAHGTGTSLGDPIEIAALAEVYRRTVGEEGGQETGRRYIGSVKSNIGHLEAAAGLAGLVKVVKMMQRRRLVPTLQLDQVNPLLDLDGARLSLSTATQDWHPLAAGAPLRAGVSAFGMGGVNSHLVLESPPASIRSARAKRLSNRSLPFLLSAKTPEALGQLLADWRQFAASDAFARTPLADICGTLAAGRAMLPCRAGCLVASHADIHAWLTHVDIAASTETGTAEPLLLRFSESLSPDQPLTDPESWSGVTGLKRPAKARLADAWERLWSCLKPAGLGVEGQGAAGGLAARLGTVARDAADSSIDELAVLDDLSVVGLEGLRTRIGQTPRDVFASLIAHGRVLVGHQMTFGRLLDAWDAVVFARCRLSARNLLMEEASDDPGRRLLELMLVHAMSQLSRKWSLDLLRDLDAPAHLKLAEWVGRGLLTPDQAASLILDPLDGVDLQSLARPVAKRHQPESVVSILVREATWDGALGALIEAWSSGADLAWHTLFKGGFRCCSLPLYPFEGTPFPIGRRDFPELTPEPLESWVTPHPPLPTRNEVSEMSTTPSSVAGLESSIRAFLIDEMARLSGETSTNLDGSRSFFDMGIGSIELQELTDRLATYFEGIVPTLLFSHSTLDALVTFLSAQRSKQPLLTASPAPSDRAETKTPPPASAGSAADAPQRMEARADEPIAIVGMSGCFPKSPDLWGFWERLRRGEDCVEQAPHPLWERALGSGPASARSRPRWGGFLDRIDRFDARLFHLSPKEAELTDPQQRLSLHNAWTTLEHGGYGRPERLAGQAVGVFWGTMWNDYSLYAAEQGYLAGDYGGPGSLYWAIANRISYFFDFRGPSLALDTACSSSLSAVHLACQAIRQGDCEMALAGGINLSLHPAKYDYLSEAMFLSSDGRCRSFGEGGDGYVPGEGVGSVLLRPLSRALADGDRIHGVIRGSAVNHGGRAAGFTVPNPNAQQTLIETALRRSGVSATEIGLVECHGTGTALGDPIEIQALGAAYAGAATASIPIGSVKSNIGHLEAAAGIAGLIKLLLAFDQGLRPASLHQTPSNARIDFASSPFRLLSQAEDWPRRPGGIRHAALSSFGAGGSNAHLILSGPEFAEQQTSEISENLTESREPAYLTARSTDALRRLAARMAEVLDGPGWRFADLRRTLATRQHFGHGLRLDPADPTEILARLRHYAGTGEVPAGCAFAEPDAASSAHSGGRLLSLPGTPFESVAYWLPRRHEGVPAAAVESGASNPASLPQPIRADAHLCRFQLDGRAPYLADHRLGGVPVLAAALGLELVRQALESLDGRALTSGCLTHLTWARPLICRQEREIQVRREGAGLTLSDARGQSLRARLDSSVTSLDPLPEFLEPGSVEIHASEAYADLARDRMQYGNAYRSLRSLRVSGDRLSAHLVQPPEAGWSRNCVLSPVLIDGALQALLLLLRQWGEARTAVPVSIGRLTWSAPLPDAVMVRARLAPGPCSGLFRADVELLDMGGLSLCRLDSVLLRAVDPDALVGAELQAEEPADGLRYWRMQWRDSPLGTAGDPRPRLYWHFPVETAWFDRTARALSSSMPIEPWHEATPLDPEATLMLVLPAPTLPADQYLWQVMETVRQLPATGLERLLLLGQDDLRVEALGGFLRCLRHERPGLKTRLVLLAAVGTPGEAEAVMAEAAADLTGEPEVRLDAEGRRRQRRELEIQPVAPTPFRPEGVWLITGGLGKLGLVMAEHLVDLGVRDLVLIGRTGLDQRPGVADRLAALGKAGARISVQSADVQNPDSLRQVLKDIAGRGAILRGVLHCAGVLRDKLLRAKTAQDCAHVVGPKIAGAINLDRLTADLPLQAFVLFSSITGVRGNLGQTDYGYANRLLDLLAEERSREAAEGRRQGVTLSIDWPLWAEGGMQVAQERIDWLTRTLGSGVLGSAQARAAFDRMLVLGQPQILVTVPLATSETQWVPADAADRDAGSSDAGSAADFREPLLDHLLALLAEQTGFPLDQLDPAAPVDHFGVDSVMAQALVKRLQETFGSLSSVLFFEYPTLDALADHLIQTRASVVERLFASRADSVPQSETGSVAPTADSGVSDSAAVTLNPDPSDHDIAIIGLAGRYPGAEDLASFWDNLRAGRDMTGRVPAERWDLDRQTLGPQGQGGYGAFIEAVDAFDPLVFGISPKDAQLMDPQARLFLETSLHALEDAGYAGRVRDLEVGVFAAAMWTQYQLLGTGVQAGAVPNSSLADIANRVSHHLGLTGPSLSIDSMCSSSLSALHLAADALRRGDCVMALAGGVNLSLMPEKYRQLIEGSFLSEDGKCRSFGEGGTGYVPGEGVGVALLKPLAQAMRDGDSILGVIKGSALNHGGAARGYMVPTPQAQSRVIARALERSGLDPQDLDYIETHGTGTALGDPIEITGLQRLFSSSSQMQPGKRWPIGSVKSQIGHLEGAAGIAAVTKVLLQFAHAELVPSLHAERQNPHIDWENVPFDLVKRVAAPDPRSGLRYALVSSFGAGGSNAAMVLAAPPEQSHPVRSEARPASYLIPISARTRSSLAANAAALLRELEHGVPSDPEPSSKDAGLKPLLAGLLGLSTQDLNLDDALADLGVDAALLQQLLVLWERETGRAHRPAQMLGIRTLGDLIRSVEGEALTQPSSQLAPRLDLEALAFTQQLGRLSLPRRLLLQVSTLDDLIAGLRAFVDGGQTAGSSEGQARPRPPRVSDADYAARDLEAIGRAWLQGAAVDWMRLYPHGTPRPLRLPGYVFDRKPYWFVPHGMNSSPEFHSMPTSREQADMQDSAMQDRQEPAVEVPQVSADAVTTGIWRGPDREERPDVARLEWLGEVALVRMDSGAQRNMFDRSMTQALTAIFEEIGRAPDAKVVVLTGTREVFSMGGTPDMLKAIAAGEANFTDVPFYYQGLLQCPVPVIAAMQGHAFGGGLLFGLYSDIPVLAEESLYSAVFADYGFSPGMGATQVLPERFGESLAVEMMYSARALKGAEIASRGANLKICPRDQVLDQALSLARTLAEKPRVTLMTMKRAFAAKRLAALPATIAAEREMHATTFTQPEVRRRLDQVFAPALETTPPVEPEARAPAEPLQSVTQAGRDDARVRLRPLVIGHTFERDGADSMTPVSLRPLRPTTNDPRRASESQGTESAYPQAHANPHLETDATPEVSPRGFEADSVEADPGIGEAIAAMVRRLLQMEEEDLDLGMSLMDQGLDSIGGVELVREINGRWSTRLEAADLYDYPSVQTLIERVRSCVPAGPASRSQAPPRPAEPTREPHVTERPEAVAEIKASVVDEPQRIRAATASLSPTRTAVPEPIAVIGMACRFPGADDYRELWENCRAGRDLMTEVPPERWSAAAFFDTDPEAPGKSISRCGGFLRDVGRFDAEFFNISPMEAMAMDPQARLALQECWHVLEDAGLTPAALKGLSCGLYLGAAAGDYDDLLSQSGKGWTAEAFTGLSPSVFPARIAYLLDMVGPAVALDTACSSSLVAVHQARRALLAGDCELAIAGGVIVTATPKLQVKTSKSGMLSPTGRCRPFSAQADGIALSEGVGLVLLKRLGDAERDGDPIHALIESSGINQDGRTNGITAPSARSQAALIRKVQAEAGIDPASIHYVEAHGTGTPLGDPIEIKALREVWGARPDAGRCLVGSVKANIGHATMAAGVAGLIKAIQVLKTGEVPAQPGLSELNPQLNLADTALRIATQSSVLTGEPAERRAAVSAFGFSGTNAHLILRAAPARPDQGTSSSDAPLDFLFSAKSADALDAQIAAFARWLEESGAGLAPEDVALTLAQGRERHAHSAVFSARGLDELTRLMKQGRDAARSDPASDLRLSDQGRLCHLPGYLFQGRVFWPSTPARPEPSLTAAPGSGHALILSHRREGDAWIGVAAADASAPVFAQHRGPDGPTLAAASSLVMMLETAARAGFSEPLTLTQLEWRLPLIARSDQDVSEILTRLSPVASGGFSVRLYSGDEDHALGHLTNEQRPPSAMGLVMDLDAMCGGLPQVVAGSELYRSFAAKGLVLGGAFAQVETLRHDGETAVVRLAPVSGGLDPQQAAGRLDAALQGVCALIDPSLEDPCLWLPVAIELFHLSGSRDPAGSVAAISAVTARRTLLDEVRSTQSFDLDLLNLDGRCIGLVRGFSLRAIERGRERSEQDGMGTTYWRPIWTAVGASAQTQESQEIAFLDEAAGDLSWETHPQGLRLHWNRNSGSAPLAVLLSESDPTALYEKARALCMAIAASGVMPRPLLLVSPDATAAQALAGFARALMREDGRFHLSVLEAAAPALTPQLLSPVCFAYEADETPWNNHFRLHGAELQRQRMEPLPADALPVGPFGYRGTWLITGGLGGLGLKCAAHLAARGARVVLLARREPSETERLEMSRITPAPRVLVADPLEDADAARAISSLGPIEGVLHCAGTLADKLCVNKTADQWQGVIAAKIGLLEAVLRALPQPSPAAVVCFSSVASVLGHAGQTDYAFANAWLDGLAAASADLISINWPWWLDGGMRLSAESRDAAWRGHGLAGLPDPDGLRALDRLMAASEPRALVLYGETNAIQTMMDASSEARPAAPASVSDQPPEDRRASLIEVLGDLIVEVLEVEPDTLAEQKRFASYGFDSISLTRFANRIGRRLEIDLSPAVFFEADTVALLADLILERHAPALPLGTSEPVQEAAPAATEMASPVTPAVVASTQTQVDLDAVAVVGMAGRFPGSPDLDTFWKHLLDQADLISEIPPERWDNRRYLGRIEPGKERTNSNWGGFIDGVDGFDARFFGISPREATLMDPQQRLFLETVWHAIEDAGVEPSTLAGSDTGLFVGVATSDYWDLILRAGVPIEAHTATGLSHSMLPNRISYLLDIHGPSEAVDTACSSSLISIARAVRAIQQGECEAAIAGGVNLMLSPTLYLAFGQAGMLSPGGRCRTFDAAADGYVRGEGVGAVYLKTLRQALADGDPVHAIIRGVGVNHGGRASSLTAPNPKAQAELIRRVLDRSNTPPETIGFVECHGTGTSLGDPVELNGLSQALTAPRAHPVYLSSVKSNIGHLEAAAGVAGFIKAVFAVREGVIPGLVHFQSLNPHARIDASQLEPLAVTRDWPQSSDAQGRPAPRRAGVSSFAFGGANAHLILESLDPELRARLGGVAPRPPGSRTRFQHQRYWLDALSEPVGAGTMPNPVAVEPAAAFRLHWIPCSAPEPRPLQGRGLLVRLDPGMDLDALIVALGSETTAAVEMREAMDAMQDRERLILVAPLAADPVTPERFSAQYASVLQPVRDLLKERAQRSGRLAITLLWCADHPMGAALVGLVQSATNEIRDWSFRAIELMGRLPGADLTAFLDPDDGLGVSLRAMPTGVSRRTLRPLEAADHADLDLGGGLTVILGGSGGIAAALTEHLARRGIASLALIGRRPLDATIEARLEVVRRTGGKALYLSLDARDAAALHRAFAEIRLRLGEPTLVIDGTLVLRDGAFGAMSEEDFVTVFESKAKVAANLEYVLQRGGFRPRTQVLQMSSVQSLLGNAGQANYAAACTYLDAIAHCSAFRTQVINWGYWGEVGAVADEHHRRMLTAAGVHPISVAQGMAAIDRCLSEGWRQMIVANGTPEALARLGVEPVGERPSELDALEDFTLGALAERLCAHHPDTAPSWDDAPAWANRLRLYPDQRPLLEGLLWHLGQNPVTAGRTELDRDSFVRAHPDYAGHLALLEAVLPRLAEVLAGEVSGAEVLFPGGSQSLIEGIYVDNPIVDQANARLADRVWRFARQGARRFIELGAGTGGASLSILERLSGLETVAEYRFTDVGSAFVSRAEEDLGGDYPFLRASVLDLSRHPDHQGLEPQSYEVAIAANVIHALPDVVGALSSVNRLLSMGGRLLLIELNRVLAFNTATFGLLPDWWSARDQDLRHGPGPLLTPRTWREALRRAGFADVELEQTSEAIVLVSATKVSEASLLVDRETIAESAALAEPESHETPAALDLDVERQVRAIIARVLRMSEDQIDPRSAFADLGLDSILAAEAARSLTQDFAVEIRPTELFNHPTLSALAARIAVLQPQVGLTETLATETLSSREPDPGDEVPEQAEADPLMDLLLRLEQGELNLADADREMERLSKNEESHAGGREGRGRRHG